ncbi:hypothetical protein ACH24_02015 [Francisella persica ATCC VR-331]|uniref:DUF3293 domain-containing protein n=1 Tax=Francisella persica ATCC VR-331 TaxID=1086726 RepID=A0AAC8VDR6_9GAMM|nr:DUF3293 domain-containing protein [Francisella persica]ALB01540.1 hypothetical protein ACH24_02015 [Francisella persica ATCC VR-331]ANH77832.1 hypothetical protein FSC845_04815 [Francisella persica ATCC VR-331]
MSKEFKSQGLCQWYFKTLFEIPVKPNKFPKEFAIITAYNPLNQKLTTQENIFRNILLKYQLTRKYNWVYQINGFDKSTQYKENGFMFNSESLDSACELGQKYSQDAIYYVIGNILYVCKCEPGKRKLIEVGKFLSRIC